MGMRNRIGDHSLDQVIWSTFWGTMYAAGWHWAIGFFVNNQARRLGQKFFRCFIHDYRPPEFRVKISITGRVLHGGVQIIEPMDEDLAGSNERNVEMREMDVEELRQLGRARGSVAPTSHIYPHAEGAEVEAS